MRYKNFYSELGKLLYAVADIDGMIKPNEKKQLLDIIKSELVPAEKDTDQFGTNAAYYAEMEFEFLDEQIADAETAFESFTDYVEEHHTALDEKKKEVCLDIVEKLAAAYRGTNKKEKELIERLRQKLDRIQFIKTENEH